MPKIKSAAEALDRSLGELEEHIERLRVRVTEALKKREISKADQGMMREYRTALGKLIDLQARHSEVIDDVMLARAIGEVIEEEGGEGMYERVMNRFTEILEEDGE